MKTIVQSTSTEIAERLSEIETQYRRHLVPELHPDFRALNDERGQLQVEYRQAIAREQQAAGEAPRAEARAKLGPDFDRDVAVVLEKVDAASAALLSALGELDALRDRYGPAVGGALPGNKMGRLRLVHAMLKVHP